MHRSLMFSCIFCLVAGLLVGGILPMPWDQEVSAQVISSTILQTSPPPSSSGEGSPARTAPEPLDSTDNFSLLNTACYVVKVLQEADYAALAAVVHPEKGVTFTPYSTVDFETDLTFPAAKIKSLAEDDTLYTWGFTDSREGLISLTMAQYFSKYVFDADYTQAIQIGVDRVMISGNALENISEAYPNCRFVDFSVPEQDSTNQGLDWCSLKLVFEPGDTGWYLVGIVHGQWTT